MALVATGDDILCKFWEVEERVIADYTLSLEEHSALEHSTYVTLMMTRVFSWYLGLDVF